MKSEWKKGAVWSLAAMGTVISVILTAVLCAAAALLIVNRIIDEEYAKYAALAVLMISVIAGTLTVALKPDKHTIAATAASGAAYLILGIVAGIIMFGTENMKIGSYSVVVMGCSSIAMLIAAKKWQGKGRSRKSAMVKLNKKRGR